MRFFMSEDLYEGLIEIYKSFIVEKENLIKKVSVNSKKNDNESQYQNYDDILSILESRINTLNSILKVFENYFSSKKNEDSSDDNKKEIEKRKCNYEKEVFNKRLQILDIQEKERQRIARDLHDTSLQNLAHLIHNIELSSLYIDEDPIRAKLELQVVIRKLKSVIQEMRNTIFDLRPMTFDDLGLKESFERLVDKLKENSKFCIDYNIENINCNNSLILMTIFRIVEECLNNAIKHSEGSKIFFEIKRYADDKCLIKVSDNGVSFDSKEIMSLRNSHFGLCILEERVKLLSGTMEIDSAPEHGTVIKIIVPLLD